jgi:penicillin-binding protein 2
VPLAQNKLGYNLAFNFPTPLEFSDPQALSYARGKIQAAEKLLGRQLKITDDLILRHYKNRGILPFEIAQNLAEEQSDALKTKLPRGWCYGRSMSAFIRRAERQAISSATAARRDGILMA